MNWADLGLSPALLDLIEKAGYKTPTPVQAQAIPFAIEGNDVLASAATGSGKTAGFVLPTVQRYIGKEGTFILALSPTREIAQQTAAVFETFGAPLGMRSTVLIGGTNVRTETAALATYPQIIVATPGRLCDHLERGNIWLDYIKTLILDEADRMLDMGFSEQLKTITDQIPKTRQTLMFSATFPPSIEKLARQVMHSPKEVRIGVSAEAAPKIEQRMIRMREEDKMSEIMKLFKEETGTIFVFARSKDRVSELWRRLHSRLVYDATYLHSDCTQSHREKALADFKAGTYRILIATDVAGRGIDVDDVAHVVNYDLPMEAEDYVHRIGRTGRRGRTGKATTFVTERDRELVKRIEKIMGLKEAERAQESAKNAGAPNEAIDPDGPITKSSMTFSDAAPSSSPDRLDRSSRGGSGGGRSDRGGRGGDRGGRSSGGRDRGPREERASREVQAPRERPAPTPPPVIDPNKPRVVISLSSKPKPVSESESS